MVSENFSEKDPHAAPTRGEVVAGVKPQPPLILVPGFMGSKLWRDASYKHPLWLSSSITNRGGIEEQIDSLEKLAHTELKYTRRNRAGLVEGWYDPLLDASERMGYRGESGLDAEGQWHEQNFWVFTYDWTQSNEHSGLELCVFIQQILTAHPLWNQVDVISHSMGGIVTREAQRLTPAAIRRAVYIGVPHYGAPKAYFVLHPKIGFNLISLLGINLSLPGQVASELLSLLALGTPLGSFFAEKAEEYQARLKKVAERLPSVYELLPDEFYFEKIPHTVLALVHIAGGNAPSPQTLADTYFHNEQSKIRNEAAVQKAMRFKSRLGRTLPGETLTIYSKSEPTAEFVPYIGETAASLEMAPQHPINIKDGDETVPKVSAQADREGGEVRGRHSDLPNQPEVHSRIEKFLKQQGQEAIVMRVAPS